MHSPWPPRLPVATIIALKPLTSNASKQSCPVHDETDQQNSEPLLQIKLSLQMLRSSRYPSERQSGGGMV